MKTKISTTTWKKNRYPRKLKKTLKNEGKWNLIKKLISISNFGREYAYKKLKQFQEKNETYNFG